MRNILLLILSLTIIGCDKHNSLHSINTCKNTFIPIILQQRNDQEKKFSFAHFCPSCEKEEAHVFTAKNDSICKICEYKCPHKVGFFDLQYHYCTFCKYYTKHTFIQESNNSHKCEQCPFTQTCYREKDQSDIDGWTGYPSDSWIMIKQRTCTQDGIVGITCEVCGQKFLELPNKAEGHKCKKEKIRDGNCTTPAYYKYICSKCDYIDEDYEGEPEHKWDEGTIIQEQACEKAEITKFTCQVCGTTKTEETADSLQHNWKYEVIKKETCTEAGEHLSTCTRCGKQQTINVPPLNHPILDIQNKKQVQQVKHDKETGEIIQPGIVEIPCALCGEVAERVTID